MTTALYSGDALSIPTRAYFRFAEIDSAAEFPDDLEVYGAGWVDSGWFDPAGVTESSAEENQSFTPYQASAPVRIVNSSRTVTFAFTLWSVKSYPAKRLFHGKKAADMTHDALTGITEFRDGGLRNRDPLKGAFDFVDAGLNHTERILVPLLEVSQRGDQVRTPTGVVGYPVTLTVFEDPDNPGLEPFIRRFKEGWAPPAP